jgi:sugar phosphate permease
MYLICFADRITISVVAPMIQREFGFDKLTMGFIFSAFVSAYALGQIPGGWIGDQLGPRRVLPGIVATWSLFTMMTSQAFSATSFLVVRFLFGFSEGGAYPTATRAMQLWYPKEERGFVQGITHSFSRFGGAIVPPVAIFIAGLWGWRAVFYVFGVAGILWAILFYAVYRNTPEENKWVNKAELAHIRGVAGDGTIHSGSEYREKPEVPWRALLTTPNMWYVVLSWVCWTYAIYFFLTWLPTYLVEYRHFPLKEMAIYASLPLLAGMIGNAAGGVLTDKVYIRTKNLKFARQVVAIPALLAAAGLMLPAALARGQYTALFSLVAAQFFLECVQGPQWSLPMDVGGKYAGTVAGLMNGCGNMAGALSPIIFGFLVQRGSWQAPFFMTAIILVLGAGIWAFLIDPDKPVTGQDAVLLNHPVVATK